MTRPGDEADWRDLFDEFYPRLLRVVRRRLDRTMRHSYSPDRIREEVINHLMVDNPVFSSREEVFQYLVPLIVSKIVGRNQAGE